MEILISFILSIMASVIAYYICKWLDGDDSGNQPEAETTSPKRNKNPHERQLVGVLLSVVHGLFISFAYTYYTI